MPDTFLSGITKATSRTITQVMRWVRTDGLVLNLTEVFGDSLLVLTREWKNEIPEIPYATTMPDGGSYALAMKEFSISVPIYSIDPVDVETAIEQIETFLEQAPGRQVSVYWLTDTSGADPYYAYIPHCKPKRVRPVRDYRSEIGVSLVDIDFESLSTRWYKVFPNDETPVPPTQYGSFVHSAATNDGSPAFIVKRESDDQGLLVLTDQGELRLLGAIKTHQDLSLYA